MSLLGIVLILLFPLTLLGQKNTKSSRYKFYQSSLNLDIGSQLGEMSYKIDGDKYDGNLEVEGMRHTPFHVRLSWEVDHFLIGKKPQIIGMYIGYQAYPLLQDTLRNSRLVVGHFDGFPGLDFNGIVIGGLAGTYLQGGNVRLSLLGRVGYESITERNYNRSANQADEFEKVDSKQNLHGLNLGAAVALTVGRVGVKGEFSTTAYSTRTSPDTVLDISLERLSLGMFFLLTQKKKMRLRK
ncbi:MAG: hypothetical protein AAGC85_23315 [Bacteroidota bacterium]